MVEKLNSLNYKKGLLRIWIVLSVIWVVVISSKLDLLEGTLSIIYCSSDSYPQDLLKLENEVKELKETISQQEKIRKAWEYDKSLAREREALIELKRLEEAERRGSLNFRDLKDLRDLRMVEKFGDRNNKIDTNYSSPENHLYQDKNNQLELKKRECLENKREIKELLRAYAFILTAPVLLWFGLLIIINLTRRLFLWVRSGFKERE